MAYENVISTLTGVGAAGNLSAHQYKLVTVSATGVALSTVDTLTGAIPGCADGVLQNKPSALGQAATVAIAPSVTKAVAGALVSAGELVMNNGSGLVIPATTGKYAVGRALTAAAASGDIITVQLMPYGTVL